MRGTDGASTHSAADVWTAGTRTLTDLTGFSLSAAGIDAIWDELVTGHVTASSFAKLLIDNLDATVSSRSSHAAADIWSVGTREITGTAAGAIVAASFGAGAIDALALATDAGQEIADRVLARNIAGGSDSGRTVTSALRRIRNRNAIAAGTLTVYQENDTTSAWTAAVTTTAGNPISEVDPA
jgi:hypothetical protein